ncbi:hypothetical protein KIN20_006500 [Parelaphostrongylus tenuis]|uniref:Uncharacterized protein n=1 Tax=Parelaphostrongylus tenuis TaxID=148309 RepID=A0AAD5MN30_PARTN|nr:hypothetical protein KIN20_006500 [Parelaphostrongylus tenuis]
MEFQWQDGFFNNFSPSGSFKSFHFGSISTVRVCAANDALIVIRSRRLLARECIINGPSKQAYLIQQSLNKYVGATGEQLAPGAVPQQPVPAAGLAPSAHALASLQSHHLNNMVVAIHKAQNAAFMQNTSGNGQATSQLAPLDIAGESVD